MRHDALLVVNERARGAGGRAALQDAVRILEGAYRVRIVAPASRAALEADVRNAPEALVIAGGGDGTVNAVVSALAPGSSLGVLPIGTANDFACVLGIPGNAAAAADRLVAGAGMPPFLSDLLLVNDRPFCTVGGVGLVERTTTAVLRMKEGSGVARVLAGLLGSAVYQLAAGATIALGRGLVDTLRVSYRDPDGTWREREIRAHALFAVNHPMCGGGLTLPTGSLGTDGVFELGIVHAGGRIALARNFSRLAARAAVPPAAFEVLRATAVTVHADAPVSFAADGELLARTRALTVTMRAGALPIRGVAPAASVEVRTDAVSGARSSR